MDSVPAQVAEMPNLFLLSFINTQLQSFDLDLSSHKLIMVLSVANTGLKDLPEALLHLPTSLRALYIIGCGAKVLPDSIGTAWSRVQALYLQEFDFETFPTPILKLEQLLELSLQNSPGITTLPSEIQSLGNLKSIQMDGCSLKHLPAEITTLTRLKIATFGGNQLESVPWSDQIVHNWHLTRGNTLFLQGNPVCDKLGPNAIIACSSGCSATCPPTIYNNRRCNFGCNSASCDWDGGDCSA